jgi:hypothetical protein
MPLFGRKEDLHRRLIVMNFLFPSTHFRVQFLRSQYSLILSALRSLTFGSLIAASVNFHVPLISLSLLISHEIFTSRTSAYPHPDDRAREEQRTFMVAPSSSIFSSLLRTSQYTFYAALHPCIQILLNSGGSLFGGT